jgi:hypothetical protein
MNHEQDMLRLWLAEWARRECFPGACMTTSIHRTWGLYWKFCSRHGRAPLLLRKWLTAVRVITGGAVQEYDDEGEACLLSEPRELVLDSLRADKKMKTVRTRRLVAR